MPSLISQFSGPSTSISTTEKGGIDPWIENLRYGGADTRKRALEYLKAATTEEERKRRYAELENARIRPVYEEREKLPIPTSHNPYPRPKSPLVTGVVPFLEHKDFQEAMTAPFPSEASKTQTNAQKANLVKAAKDAVALARGEEFIKTPTDEAVLRPDPETEADEYLGKDPNKGYIEGQIEPPVKDHRKMSVPDPSVTTIEMSDGTFQELGIAYPYAGGQRNLIEAGVAAGIKRSQLQANPQHGGFREDPRDRIMENPDQYAEYFTEGLPPTKENIKPEMLRRLWGSDHNLDAQGGGVPSAIDFHFMLTKEADLLEKIDGPGAGYTLKGKAPTNRAFRASEVGKFLTENHAYNALANGWVPVGDDLEYYNKFGPGGDNSEPNLSRGIMHGEGRYEHWHYKHDPDEAERRLIKLEYMDPITKELLPPVSAFSIEATKDSEVVRDKDGKIIGAGQGKGSGKKYADGLFGQAQELFDKRKIEEGAQAAVAGAYRDTKSAQAAHEANIQDWGKKAQASLKEKLAADKKVAEDQEELALAKRDGEIANQVNINVTQKKINELQEDYKEEANFIMADLAERKQWIKDNRPDPYRMFAWINDDKTATTGQTLLTIGAILALIANIAVTAKTALKKKGKTFPLMAWDMITGAINMDIKAQESALAGAQSEMNADISYLGQMRDVLDNDIAAAKQTRVAYLEHYLSQLDQKEAEFGKKGMRESKYTIGLIKTQTEEKVAALKKEISGLIYGSKQTELALATGRYDKLASHEAQGLSLVISAGGAEARARAKANKGLTNKQSSMKHQMFALMFKIKEASTRWGMSGDTDLAQKWLATKGVFKLFQLTDSQKDLAVLSEMRQMLAASLAKMQGNVGNLAENEQLRAMLTIPTIENDELGKWKLQRAWTATRLGAMDAFYLMDDKTKWKIMRDIAAMGNDRASIIRQDQYMQNLIESLGGDALSQGKTDEEMSKGFKAVGSGKPKKVPTEKLVRDAKKAAGKANITNVSGKPI